MDNSYYNVPIRQDLKPFIRQFWVLHCRQEEVESPIYYATADSTMKLIFVFRVSMMGQLEFIYSSIHGQSGIFGQYQYENGLIILGVHLQPFISASLLNVSPKELMDQIIDFEDLLFEGKLLNEQLSYSANTEKAVRIINNFFNNENF